MKNDAKAVIYRFKVWNGNVSDFLTVASYLGKLVHFDGVDIPEETFVSQSTQWTCYDNIGKDVLDLLKLYSTVETVG